MHKLILSVLLGIQKRISLSFYIKIILETCLLNEGNEGSIFMFSL